MRTWIVLLAMALAFAAADAAGGETARKNTPPASPELRQAMAAAHALAGRVEPATAVIALEAVTSHPGFADLDGGLRAAWLLFAARVAVDGDLLAQALPLARASVAADAGDADAWFLLGQLAENQEQYAEAALAMARFATDWPDLVGHAPYQPFNQVLHGLGDDPAAGPLFEALHAAGWAPEGLPADEAWARLALVRDAAGDTNGARALVAGVRDPHTIVWMRHDRRFDTLIDHASTRLDPARAADAWVDHVEALAAAEPHSLPLQVALCSALLQAGRPEAVLALAESILAAGDTFDDAGDLPWVLNQRAIALRRLGRSEDAVAALETAATLQESGMPNVSQVLNLGTLLVDSGRPDDALAAVARLDGMSGYGQLVQASVRMRAQLQLGRPQDAGVWFDRIREGREAGPRLLLEALLWNGDLDGAARELQALLADPRRRAEALDWCLDYLAPPPLPGRVPLVEARARLLQRADVRAAIDAVGRAGTVGIHASVGIH